MNRFFEKGIELAEQEYVKTGDFKVAIDVLEKTCGMCKTSLPCRTCVIGNKIEEFESPRKQVAAVKEVIVTKTKTTITTVVETEVTTYKIGDKVIDGHVFQLYRRNEK